MFMFITDLMSASVLKLMEQRCRHFHLECKYPLRSNRLGYLQRSGCSLIDVPLRLVYPSFLKVQPL